MGVLVIAEGRTWFFRTALFIGLGSVVATIIYLTPVPDRYPQSCSRACHELDWPMICRVKLTLEPYQTLSGACGRCPGNVTDCYSKHCVTADGTRQGLLTANRQFPGPNIQVCQNDIIVVDVVNRIPGQSFGIHWRGQPQRETPHMDGAPMVTQCPIPSFTTFQYKFRASDAGTHMWQVNTGEEALSTLFGGFIVRQPESRELHRKLYDTDEPGHVVTIHGWSGQRVLPFMSGGRGGAKLLINGKLQSKDSPPAVYEVSAGKRHRFRVLFGGLSNGCQVALSVDSHQLLVVALDGHSMAPQLVTAARLSQGERMDFILHANQPAGAYSLNVIPVGDCKSLSPAAAVVRYEGHPDTDAQQGPGKHLKSVELATTHDPEICASESMACVNALHGVHPLPPDLAVEQPDNTFYLFFGQSTVSSQNISNTSFIALESRVHVAHTNNLTMMLPPSPLLSQSGDLDPALLCNTAALPPRCHASGVCECVHVLHVPLDTVVELVLVNRDGEEPRGHVFHLHGYSFHVLGVGHVASNYSLVESVMEEDKHRRLVARNLARPIVKDTVHVPANSAAVVRFLADNPGYWLLSEELATHWSRGMSVVLHVGTDSDLPDTPQDFPKCGNWIGPEFFLV